MKIKRCRLSCVWVDAVPNLLNGPTPGPLGGIIDGDRYADCFNQLLGGNSSPLVDLPWQRKQGAVFPEKNNYWTDAIIKNLRDHLNANRGKLAWKAAVQLRHKPDFVKIGHADRSFVEGWYFPHGVALSVTAWLSGDLDGDQLKQEVSNFQGTPLSVTWPAGSCPAGTQPIASLDTVAGKAMDILRKDGFGLGPSDFTPEHLRILTIISAEHDSQERDKVAAEATMLQNVLTAAGGAPDVQLTPSKHIYALSHGRVIWRPDCFLSTQKGLHKLGCLHRNVTMATLHVAALIRAAEVMVADIESTGQVPPWAEPYERAVAGSLGRIYGLQDGYTYKQKCLRDQIDQAKEVVNRLRKRHNMLPLK